MLISLGGSVVDKRVDSVASDDEVMGQVAAIKTTCRCWCRHQSDGSKNVARTDYSCCCLANAAQESVAWFKVRPDVSLVVQKWPSPYNERIDQQPDVLDVGL